MKKMLYGFMALALGLVLVMAPQMGMACGEDKGASASASCCPASKGASADKNTEAKAQMVGSGSCSGMSGEAKATTAAAGCDYKGKCAEITMNIKGMHCGACETTITNALKGEMGVIKVVSIDYKTGKAIVCYDPDKAESAKLAALVTKTGYEAEVIPAVATSATGTTKAARGAVCDMTGKCETKKDAKDTKVSGGDTSR